QRRLLRCACLRFSQAAHCRSPTLIPQPPFIRSVFARFWPVIQVLPSPVILLQCSRFDQSNCTVRGLLTMSRYVSVTVLTVILLILGYMTFEVMAGFILPLFLALLLVVVFRPVHLWLVDYCRGYNRVAAGLTTLVILLIVLIPLVLMSVNAAIEAVSLVGKID